MDAVPLIDDLPQGWRFERFADLLAEPVRNGIYKSKEYRGRGQKMVNMGELFSYDFISDQHMRRIELNDRECSKYLLQDGDLLFARRSLVLEGSGKCSLVVSPPEDTTFESSIIRARPDPGKAYPRFCLYFWHSPIGRALMASIATRTAVSGIRGSELVELTVPLPPLPTQRKIAAILSAYDHLIENNTRRIAILEEIAGNLYREWFVRFRFPGHEEVPLVDSCLGPIPESWDLCPFSGIATFVNGYAFKPHHWGQEGLPIVKIAELKKGITEKTPFNDGATIPEKFHITSGDVLFSWSAHLDAYIWPHGPALLNQHLFNVVPNQGFSKAFLFHALKDRMQEFRNLSLGTTMRHIKRAALNQVQTPIPLPSFRHQFDALVEPLILSVLNLTDTTKTLRRTRDLLLRRLISGHLDVSDLEIDIGERSI